MQPRGVYVDPRAFSRGAVNGHIPGQMTHQEEEETRPGESHQNLAANRGRDELACGRDDIVHRCRLQRARLVYSTSSWIASKIPIFEVRITKQIVSAHCLKNKVTEGMPKTKKEDFLKA